MAERKEFANDWYLKGADALDKENVFEAFIYLWLALTIAANEHYGNNKRVKRFSNDPKDENITDRKKIEFWGKGYAKTRIFEILKANEDDIRELCERKQPNAEEPILDIKISKTEGLYSKVLRDHKYFQDYWQDEIQHVDKLAIGVTFIHILHDVRNNLFHGDKSYQVESDRRLLEVLYPSLKSTAKLCIDQLT